MTTATQPKTIEVTVTEAKEDVIAALEAAGAAIVDTETVKHEHNWYAAGHTVYVLRIPAEWRIGNDRRLREELEYRCHLSREENIICRLPDGRLLLSWAGVECYSARLIDPAEKSKWEVKAEAEGRNLYFEWQAALENAEEECVKAVFETQAAAALLFAQNPTDDNFRAVNAAALLVRQAKIGENGALPYGSPEAMTINDYGIVAAFAKGLWQDMLRVKRVQREPHSAQAQREYRERLATVRKRFEAKHPRYSAWLDAFAPIGVEIAYETTGREALQNRLQALLATLE